MSFLLIYHFKFPWQFIRIGIFYVVLIIKVKLFSLFLCLHKIFNLFSFTLKFMLLSIAFLFKLAEIHCICLKIRYTFFSQSKTSTHSSLQTPKRKAIFLFVFYFNFNVSHSDVSFINIIRQI